MNPYEIVKCRRVTEKSRVLENLQHAASNPSVSRCKSPKIVFDVSLNANKLEIKKAIEEIYADKKVKVVSVNTISIPSKWRRVRGHIGKTSRVKKAVVTFRPGDAIEEKGS
jgi:large subunit ribosomal protein L23